MGSDMTENMRRIGSQMANVLFNLCQNRDIPAHTRDTMKELQRQWDDAVSASPSPSPKPGGTSVANFEAHLTRILEEYEQRREAIQEDEEVKDRFIILRAFELAVAAREDQP